MSNKDYCECLCHQSIAIVNCSCCQSAYNIPKYNTFTRIQKLEEHHTRQIDENRKISRRLDELTKYFHTGELDINDATGLLNILDGKVDLINEGMAKIEERLIALEKDYKSDIDATVYILKSVEARLTALEPKNTEESELNPNTVPIICGRCSGNGKYVDKIIIPGHKMCFRQCEMCFTKGYTNYPPYEKITVV